MEQSDFSSQLEIERSKHTWYTSLTDSLIISEFYHANAIAGIKCRPNFLTLRELGDPLLVNKYRQAHGLKRIVLLEDFVGTGLQGIEIVQWALTNTDVSILFCPMVICPDGFRRFSALAQASNGRLRVDPVVKLGDSAFLSSSDRADPVMNQVNSMANRIHASVAGSNPDGTPPYSSHGFFMTGDSHTGATVVMFSNTPDNTIPIVHFDSSLSDWRPVFPRVSRETS